MCLITKKKSFSIAKEDIKVWKAMRIALDRDGYTSPFQYFTYRPNILYKQPIKLIPKKEFVGRTVCAFDTYVTDYLNKNHGYINNGEYIPALIYIREGLHSIIYKDRAERIVNGRQGMYVIEFVIPRGSRYYEDGTGLCVSNRLILKKHKKICV